MTLRIKDCIVNRTEYEPRGDMMLRFIAILIVGVCTWANVATAQVLPAYSTWQNQRGSIMKIFSVNPSSGAFNGIYINNASGFQCRGTPYDLNGRTIGTAITFTVVWKIPGRTVIQ